MATLKKIVEDYCDRFPTLKDYTLAKLIQSENPIQFKSVENARSTIRKVRGHMGAERLKYASRPTPLNHDCSRMNADIIRELESKAEGLKTFKLPECCRKVLFMSDIHLPYQDNDSLITALNYGLEKQVDTIFLGGDILDMYGASFHEKFPDKPTIRDEFEMGRSFLERLRKLFPNASIYYLEGNHEKRWKRYLASKAAELFGNPEFELPFILRFGEYNVNWIPNGTLVKFGKLNVIHGNEFKGGGGVNPARALFLRAKDNVLAGDKHKTGENNEGSLNGSLVTTWSVGCLCDLNPEYLPFAHTIWNHGFAYIEIEGDNFHVENKRIKNGKVL